jgi:hypothetical protein
MNFEQDSLATEDSELLETKQAIFQKLLMIFGSCHEANRLDGAVGNAGNAISIEIEEPRRHMNRCRN